MKQPLLDVLVKKIYYLILLGHIDLRGKQPLLDDLM